MTYHGGVAVNDFRYLAGEQTVDLDWNDPWYSRFKNKQFKRLQQSGVLTFLYVEPFEVRHEVLVSGQVANDWLEAQSKPARFVETHARQDDGELAREQLRGAADAAERVLDFMCQSTQQFVRGLLLHDQTLLLLDTQVMIYLSQLDQHM